mgnify:CR=1 FL=1
MNRRDNQVRSEAMSLKGRENVYTCQKCGGYTVTVDADEGTTPFMIGCRAKGIGVCDGTAYSAFYPEGPRPKHIPAPAWKWVRPTGEAYEKLSPAMKEYVDMGGLELVGKD